MSLLTVDLGDQVTLSWAYGSATTAALTVTLPDGSTVTPSVTGTTSFTATYTPTLPGRHIAAWVGTGSNPGAFVDTFEVVASAESPLVSMDEIRAYLGIAQSGTDERLRFMALSATEMCERYTGRTWRRAVATETYSGGKPVIILRRTPVLSISTVVESGATLSNTTDWILSTGGVLTRGTTTLRSRWLLGTENVSVTYIAGPSDGRVPAPIRHGVLEMTRHLWDTMRGGYSLPRTQGTADEWDPRQGYSIPRRVSQLWDPYCIVAI